MTGEVKCMGRRERRKCKWLASGDEKGLHRSPAGMTPALVRTSPSYILHTCSILQNRSRKGLKMRPGRHQSIPVKSCSHPPHLHTCTLNNMHSLKGREGRLRIRKNSSLLRPAKPDWLVKHMYKCTLVSY